MKVFGIFEGGGVRGYAHIGALRAIERRGIGFEAVAGTSIGAIVAVLVAAGYNADDLLRLENGEEHGIAAVSPSAFFAAEDLATVQRLSADVARFKWLKKRWVSLGIPSPLDLRGTWLFAFTAWLAIPIFWVCAPIAYLRHRRAARRLWRNFGLVGTRAAQDWLDAKLRSKLGLEKIERKLVFADLHMPLRVIVSDVSSGTMRVLGADGDEPLVEGVLASASYPLFFAPDTSGGKSLVDGGILSNLPAWVFDRQRAAAPMCVPTIAFRLVGNEESGDLVFRTLARFVPRLLGTMLDGARELQFRRIDEHHLIPLRAEIEVLAFDRIEGQRGALVRAGEEAVDEYFERNVGPVDPARANALLREVAAHAKQVLNTTALLRAWVLVVADEEYLRVAYSANMEQDADDQLLIRRSSPGVASAFEEREPVLVNLQEVTAAFRNDPYYKYEHALRAPSVKFACAIPIFADPQEWSRVPKRRQEPVAVLGLDLDEEARLLFLSEKVENRLATYAQIVGERLRERTVSPLTTDAYARPFSASSGLRRIAPGVDVYRRKTRSLVFDEDAARLSNGW